LVASLALILGACQADPAANPLPDGGSEPSAKPETIVAVGDIGCPTKPCPEQRATADLTEGIDPVAVLALGDLQYPDGALDDFMSSYEPTWGRFADRTRPVPGNHEYHEDGALGYFDYFGASAHEGRGGWYSFEVGDWHLVAINSGPGTISQGQLAWVEADLARDDHRCELAFWHHPRFTSGTEHGPDSDPTIESLWGALHAAGVDLIVNAHEHNYERFAPLDADGRPDPASGIRQFVVGTGGRSLYPFGPPATGSESRIGDAFGVLELTLQRTGYGWRFVDVEGKVLDEGDGRCHG
jgi:calcineurin-like phosphoesterase family protein